jgi:hypothetical protein
VSSCFFKDLSTPAGNGIARPDLGAFRDSPNRRSIAADGNGNGMSTNLDQELDRLDTALAAAERQAMAVLAGIKGLRRQAATGTVAGLAKKLEQLPAAAAPLAEVLRAAGENFDYDAEAAFSDGAYLAALRAEAATKGLVMVERDGRITAFPLLLKLEPGIPAVRIGKKLERQLRPGVLTGVLKKAQDSAAFNPEAFLEMLFRAATHLARADARADEPAPGAVVPLLDIHELLTLRPGAAAEYPREAFAVDLLRLDRAPDTTTRRGHRFSLPASTGSKGRARLTVYDEHGAEHVYVGIAFRREPVPRGGER